MIKKSLLITVLMMIIATSFSQTSVDRLRKAFFAMKSERCGAETLFKMANQDNYNDAVVQAYAGAGEAAMAECMSGPLDKLGTFKRGKKNLEEAMEKDAADAEIRFLRFATQANIPFLLAYDNMRDDKQVILRRLPQLLKDDKDGFWKNAAQFMINTGELNKNEAVAVRNALEGARL